MNPPAIPDWFGGVKHFPQLAQRVRITECGVPVRVAGDRDLASLLRYANHSSSAELYAGELIQKMRDDVLLGRAFFPRVQQLITFLTYPFHRWAP